MSNETTTGAPLAATVGERLEEKVHEGDAATAASLEAARDAAQPGEGSGVDRAERAVAELEGEGRGRPGRADASAERGPRERLRPAIGRRSRLGWGLAAALGTFVVVGMFRRVLGR